MNTILVYIIRKKSLTGSEAEQIVLAVVTYILFARRLVRKSFGTLDILSEDFFEVIISFFRQIS
jgi:hypothetical protein